MIIAEFLKIVDFDAYKIYDGCDNLICKFDNYFGDGREDFNTLETIANCEICSISTEIKTGDNYDSGKTQYVNFIISINRKED